MWKIIVLLFCLSISNTLIAQKKSRSRTNPAVAKKVVPCNLTIENAPKLRGFYLGQSPDEIGNKIPSFMNAYNNSTLGYGLNKSTDFRIVHLTSLDSYDGISKLEDFRDVNITWQFYNEMLVRLFVTYTEFMPGNIQNFINQMSEKTDLPKESFRITDKHKSKLNCNGFTVELHEGEYTKVGWFPESSQIVLEDTYSLNEIERLEKEYKKQAELEKLQLKREEIKRRTTLKP